MLGRYIEEKSFFSCRYCENSLSFPSKGLYHDINSIGIGQHFRVCVRSLSGHFQLGWSFSLSDAVMFAVRWYWFLSAVLQGPHNYSSYTCGISAISCWGGDKLEYPNASVAQNMYVALSVSVHKLAVQDAVKKSSPLKFSLFSQQLFKVLIWNFTALFTKTIYIQLPSKIWFCWKKWSYRLFNMTAYRFLALKMFKMMFNFQKTVNTLLPMTSQWCFDKQQFILFINYQ